jgi:hypothetical protein
MRFSSTILRSVLALVTKAREEGPKQFWKVAPKPAVSDSNKGRFGHRSSELRRDPKMLFASDIAQSLAESTLEALHLGSLSVALLRAKRAAEFEEKYSRPGVYQELFESVSCLLSEPKESQL